MSERLRSIVEGLRIQADDQVLEIGCGHGVAASFVCERLGSGRLVAIDKSKKMIAASLRRNRRHVDAGRAEFHVADALEFEPGRRKFDKIFAVRVGLLHRDPALARRILEPWLAPRGKIVLVYDEP
ncbi:SAM-dependent methyltransferase [Peristeroidobacter agariperforans]|uniref:SAM-dependent methyltransferase n=1 Tax=Peristeroidobacter agariperforans TaxID=268404 RepID=UPI00101B9A0F|nr:class I SAM-dependent methyltransferase [Peristeroidobacter agariperforans]